MGNLGRYALAAATIVAATTSAQGAGALVVGVDPAQPAALSYAWSANHENEGEAKYSALLECLTSKGETTIAARAACRLVTIFNKQCVSFSWDPKPGETGWSWAVHADRSTADKQALAKCNAMPGASRTGYCIVQASECDTVGSGAPAVASAPSPVEPVSMLTTPAAPAEPRSGHGAKMR